ncbi:hypothetical protein FOL47_000528, partial [Perkinsus chesapeaki]
MRDILAKFGASWRAHVVLYEGDASKRRVFKDVAWGFSGNVLQPAHEWRNMPAQNTDAYPTYWLRTDQTGKYTWSLRNKVFNRVVVPGDGNCMFYSALISVKELSGRLPNFLRDKNEALAPGILREKVCDYLGTHPPDAATWAAQLVSDIEQADFRTRGLPLKPTWEEYVKSMRHPKAWGGIKELHAIAALFERRVYLLQLANGASHNLVKAPAAEEAKDAVPVEETKPEAEEEKPAEANEPPAGTDEAAAAAADGADGGDAASPPEYDPCAAHFGRPRALGPKVSRSSMHTPGKPTRTTTSRTTTTRTTTTGTTTTWTTTTRTTTTITATTRTTSTRTTTTKTTTTGTTTTTTTSTRTTSTRTATTKTTTTGTTITRTTSTRTTTTKTTTTKTTTTRTTITRTTTTRTTTTRTATTRTTTTRTTTTRTATTRTTTTVTATTRTTTTGTTITRTTTTRTTTTRTATTRTTTTRTTTTIAATTRTTTTRTTTTRTTTTRTTTTRTATTRTQEILRVKKENKHYCILSVDVADAFGSISHEGIIKALEENNEEELTIRWIEKWLKNRSSYGHFMGECQGRRPREDRGVAQGSVGGPRLFTAAIDHKLVEAEGLIMRKLETILKICSDNIRVRVLAFADDVSILIGFKKKLKNVDYTRIKQIAEDAMNHLFQDISLTLDPTKGQCLTNIGPKENRGGQGSLRLLGYDITD